MPEMNSPDHTSLDQFPMEDAPEHLASECLSKLHSSQDYPRQEIERLARLAASDDERAAQQASTAIFTSLVEPLADSFEPTGVSFYNRIFAQLIQSSRTSEKARELNQRLSDFGLHSEQNLYVRAEQLRRMPKDSQLPDPRRLKRVIVLSRVTLGADVAISSVMMRRGKERFPDADIVLVGGPKTTELFGGDPRLSFANIEYRRTGTLADRLLSWLDLLEVVRSHTEGLERDESLIIDPDSRLTQLGMLPVGSPAEKGRDGFLYFPSREYGAATSRSLGDLTSDFLNEVFDHDQVTLPYLALKPQDVDISERLARRLKRANERPIVTLNFGIGGNQAKGVGGWFEAALVSTLINDGARVILDRGAGAEEAGRANATVRYARECGARVVEFDEGSLAALLSSDALLEADLLVWNGRVGLLAGLIANSRLYIGYDSAGQHIAAALGVPCIDVMAGFSSLRMIDRWRPTGPAETRVVVVSASVLEESIGHAREMLRA